MPKAKEVPFTDAELKKLMDSPFKIPARVQLGFPVTRIPKKRKMRAYAIVARREPILFGRKDNEFYGAIWIYPSKKRALGHCGPAGKVIPLEVTFLKERS